MVADGDIIYEPGPEVRHNSRIGRYMDWLADEHGLAFDTYGELWQWSVDDIDAFWRSLWDYFGVESSTPVGPVLGRREMPGAEWFPGTRLNYAGEYLRAAAGRDDDVAVIGVSQTREKVTWTFGDLNDQIARVRAGLVRLGVTRGDRVVAYMPNVPETVAAFLATASLGATWAAVAPEFGPQAVIDRFGQLEPSVLLTVDGYRYGDKDVDIRGRVAAIRAALPSLQHTVALTYNGSTVDDTIAWDAFTSERGDARRRARAVRPSAVRAVLVGDHRPAEGDRARPRRDHPRGVQEPRAQLGPRPGRPADVVHHDGVDDVERARVDAADRRVDRVPRRQPDVARPRRAVADRRGRAADDDGARAGVRHGLRQAGQGTGGDLRPVVVADVVRGRLPAPDGGVRLAARTVRQPRADLRRQWWDRRVHRARAGLSDRAGVRR